MSRQSADGDRRWALLFALVLVTMPALTLVVAFAVLSLTQTELIGQLTAFELVELYVIELAAFAVFSYILYRTGRFAWAKHDDSVGGPPSEHTPEDEAVSDAQSDNTIAGNEAGSTVGRSVETEDGA
ncbi:hypothetical protein C440_05952 [Haloferax mucosum ATCC BAA-1512]|uniref:Uncharacterized protein n=1 Tax=Haloferax mucosum ATCC BAA-1512 TaxID=662479 RepID=M0IK18_9EURY|nr:hypothetical protein [Haloferax mucosum]ELZ95809.1 hypothetical protein C440_05952 [Haloferax mucosum ATCC BAA-1512]